MDYSNRFKEGQEVSKIYYPDDSYVEVGDLYEANDQGLEVENITVTMENGQMAGVPWFNVWVGGRIVAKHNGAHLACIIL